MREKSATSLESLAAAIVQDNGWAEDKRAMAAVRSRLLDEAARMPEKKLSAAIKYNLMIAERLFAELSGMQKAADTKKALSLRKKLAGILSESGRIMAEVASIEEMVRKFSIDDTDLQMEKLAIDFKVRKFARHHVKNIGLAYFYTQFLLVHIHKLKTAIDAVAAGGGDPKHTISLIRRIKILLYLASEAHRVSSIAIVSHQLSGFMLRKSLDDQAYAHLKRAVGLFQKSKTRLEDLLSSLKVRLGSGKLISSYGTRVKLYAYRLALSSFVHTALLSIEYSLKVVEAGLMFSARKKKVIGKEAISQGDILLYYYLEEKLRGDWINQLETRIQCSRIVHASMVYKSGRDVQVLHATSASNRARTSLLRIPKGIVCMVFRPRVGKRRGRLLSSMEACETDVKTGGGFSYSYAYYWVAMLVGLVYSLGIQFLRKIIILPNPRMKSRAIICSQLIDDIFKRVGIYLTPRSEYEGIVGPSEFLFSPCLEFRGFIVNSFDRDALMREKLVV